MPKKGRARRFREARELKQGYDDGLFKESGKTLADADEGDEGDEWSEDSLEDDGSEEGYDWDPDRQTG